MRYVIVTPAYNEEQYICKTIESVLVQTIKPLLWIIVDDGSTDQTANIIKRYTVQYSWIRYVYRPKNAGQSYYASNVYAIGEGIKNLRETGYDFIAILDADITLPPNYYAEISSLFSGEERLGIASGHCMDRVKGELKKGLYDWRSSPKNIMVFRKECYEDIGGFIPLKHAGEDTCACFMARMKGWKTWATTDILVIHNKPMGSGINKSKIKIRFQQGIGEYYLASHPLFILLKSLRRCIKEPPFLIGGLTLLAGFVYASFLKEPRQISDELIHYIRKEQLRRVFHGNRIPAELQASKNNEDS